MPNWPDKRSTNAKRLRGHTHSVKDIDGRLEIPPSACEHLLGDLFARTRNAAELQHGLLVQCALRAVNKGVVTLMTGEGKWMSLMDAGTKLNISAEMKNPNIKHLLPDPRMQI